MPRLFDRRLVLAAVSESGDSRRWEDLRIDFDITKVAGSKPDTAKITIYNLSLDSRRFLQAAIGIILAGGYKDLSGNLFVGKLTRMDTKYDSPDIKSIIQCMDGIDTYANTPISTTFNPGTPFRDIFRVLRQTTGLPINVVNESSIEGITLRGITMHGPVSWYLDDIATRVGASWSIQDGELLFLFAGQSINEEAIIVSPQSGLIGTPEELTKTSTSGKRIRTIGLSWTMLLDHRARPCKIFGVMSKQYRGFYMGKKVTHTGSNFDGPFYSKIEAESREPRHPAEDGASQEAAPRGVTPSTITDTLQDNLANLLDF